MILLKMLQISEERSVYEREAVIYFQNCQTLGVPW
jgi:hypothetical protein